MVLKYKLVIFDFDGTLADTFPWLINVINQVAEQYNFKKITQSDYEIIRGYGANQVLKYLDIPLWKMPMIENRLKTLMAQDIQRIPLVEGITKLLQRLSDNGVTLAIVTSNTYENVYQILGPEISALINYYECDVPTFGKPNKLRKILGKSGIPDNESIYIGDEKRDSEAANKTNIAFGAVSWGYNTTEVLLANSPKHIFAHVNEMMEQLLNITNK
jgi:phosphoglycolate phosphatase